MTLVYAVADNWPCLFLYFLSFLGANTRKWKMRFYWIGTGLRILSLINNVFASVHRGESVNFLEIIIACVIFVVFFFLVKRSCNKIEK